MTHNARMCAYNEAPHCARGLVFLYVGFLDEYEPWLPIPLR